MIIRGRGLVEGKACGEILVSEEPISFYGSVDPVTGKIVERGHPLYGETIAKKILVFPYGKGSTVGSYIILRLARRGLAPAGIVNIESEQIIIIGCMISSIPLMDRPEKDVFKYVESGNKGQIIVRGKNGLLRIY